MTREPYGKEAAHNGGTAVCSCHLTSQALGCEKPELSYRLTGGHCSSWCQGSLSLASQNRILKLEEMLEITVCKEASSNNTLRSGMYKVTHGYN